MLDEIQTQAPVVPELPTSGGSYVMNPDGTLTKVEGPKTADVAAQTYPEEKE